MKATSSSTHRTCFDRPILTEFVLGKLPMAELERIATELETCPECQALLETLDGLEDSLVSDLKAYTGSVPLSPELQQQICRAEQIGRDVWGAPGSAEDATPIPQTLGQYQVLEMLGQGGMGAVYRAHQPGLKRSVAIKVLRAERLGSRESIVRFQREAEAVGRLDHPNLVRAHDAGEAEGRHYLVMEYLDGLDLARLVRRRGPMPVPDACEAVRQAAAGLQYAHEHGLVHRDVKPSNLMLTAEGQLKVLDLGLARPVVVQLQGGDMTDTGQAMGTGDYLAPEQAQDARNADARSDIYSLGCTLYFLLAGRPPFSGPAHNTFVRKVLAHSREVAPPIRSLRPDVPEAVEAVLTRMLAKDPRQRFRTAGQVARALARFTRAADLRGLSAVGVRTPPESPAVHESFHDAVSPPAGPSATGRSWRTVVGGLVVSALLAALLFGPPFLRGSAPGDPVAAEESGQAGARNGQTVPVSGRPVAADGGGSAAATAYLADSGLPDPAREAMLTVLRQHPAETRWSGRSGRHLFAVAVRALPGEQVGRSATPAFLELTHMLAVHELLKAKSLLDRYARAGLTDATTLRQAVVQAAGSLEVTGSVEGLIHQATTRKGFAVAYVLADEAALTAHLLQPAELGRVRRAYRDVMHRQARELMKRANWKDALLLWRHLHARELVSPELYLDAARCFRALGRDADAVRVLTEATETLGPSASPEFLEEAGDLALAIQTLAGQKLAERAYRAASELLKERISQPGDRVGDYDK